MRDLSARKALYVACVVVLASCADSGIEPSLDAGALISMSRFENSEWSAPVHLDAPINSAARELRAALSNDELALFFNSDRAGGVGAFDIWVSRRDCRACAWKTPQNLGAAINSSRGDGGMALSGDGHLLFFSGSRDGGFGGEDIWLARRVDVSDDLGWEEPVNLGAFVNTSANEGGTGFSAAGAGANLYFSRNGDIYSAHVSREGIVAAPAGRVEELSDPVGNESEPTVSTDGKEIYFFSSGRPGGRGGADIWFARRRTPNDPWGTPQPLLSINSQGAELSPSLSRDGRTLFVAFGFPGHGGLGFQDIWMLTRREAH